MGVVIGVPQHIVAVFIIQLHKRTQNTVLYHFLMTTEAENLLYSPRNQANRGAGWVKTGIVSHIGRTKHGVRFAGASLTVGKDGAEEMRYMRKS